MTEDPTVPIIRRNHLGPGRPVRETREDLQRQVAKYKSDNTRLAKHILELRKELDGYKSVMKKMGVNVV